MAIMARRYCPRLSSYARCRPKLNGRPRFFSVTLMLWMEQYHRRVHSVNHHARIEALANVAA